VLSSSSRAHLSLHSFPTRRSSDLQPQEASLDGGPGPVSGFQQIRKLGEGKKAASQIQRPPGQILRKIRRQGGKAAVQQKAFQGRSEEHTSELQSRFDLVCRLLLEK